MQWNITQTRVIVYTVSPFLTHKIWSPQYRMEWNSPTSPPLYESLFKKSLKCYRTRPKKLSFRNTSQHGYLLRYIHSALLPVLETHSAHSPGQLWSNDHTYCDMLLKLCTCNSRTGRAAKEYALRYRGRRHLDDLDATVFRRLEQRLRETKVQHLRYTWMPMDYTNINQWRCPNCSCGTTALKKLTPCHNRNTSWWSSASTLVAEHASVSGRSSSSCEAEVVVSTRQSSSAQWGRCQAIAESGLIVLGRFRGLLSGWI